MDREFHYRLLSQAAKRAMSARLHRTGLVNGLIGLHCLSGLGFINSEGNAEEVMQRWRIAAELTVVEQEKAKPGNAGSEFNDCASGCPVMIVVPAGKFIMGSPNVESGRVVSEGPQHEVTIVKPFAISKFEVSFEEWDSCVVANACPPVPDRWGRGKMPVTNVSWSDSTQYASWLSRLTGKKYRLLSEAEWEYAARSGASTRYFWGDDPGNGNANCDGCGSHWDRKQAAPVGSFKPNAFGLYDIHGNVWEWVEDYWHDDYNGATTNGSPWLKDGDPSYRVIRGGSWRNDTELVRVAVRAKRNINVKFDTLGFRVARILDP